MISFIKKVNRGALLSLLILLIVSGYLLSVEVSRSMQGPAIMDACQEYMSEYNKWIVLPEQYRMNAPGVNLSAHVSSLRDSVSQYLSPTDNQLQYELDSLRKNFENQQKVGPFILAADKKITENPVFSFHDNEVMIKFTTLTTISYMYLGDINPQESVVQSRDLIVLEKVDDEWKVLYSIINYTLY